MAGTILKFIYSKLLHFQSVKLFYIWYVSDVLYTLLLSFVYELLESNLHAQSLTVLTVNPGTYVRLISMIS